MSDKKYVLLDFGHDEINELLKKINDGMVLSKEQYQKLIKEIGLDKISTFDGDYNKLKNLPQIPTKVSELEFDIELDQGMEEKDVKKLIQNAIEDKADKEQLEDINDDIVKQLASKVDVEEGYSLMSDKEIERLAKVDNYDDSELKNEIEDLREAGDEQKQSILTEVEDMLKNKIDVQPGKSLVDDAEIERLSKVDNFDDSEIQSALQGKADNEMVESVQNEINQLNEQVAKKVDAKEGYSLMPNEEIERLAEVDNYDDFELKNEIENLKDASDEQKQEILTQVEDMLKSKMDIEPGKSLVDDAEIERLSKVDNFDDSEIQLALRGKVDNEVIESVQDEINQLSERVAKKVDVKEGYSFVSDEEIERLAEVFNYDDTEVRGLLLDDEPYEMDFNNKHYVFACGHPVFAETVNEQLVIKMGTTPEGMRQIIVPNDLVPKTIIVGGFGIKNINKSRHLASTYVHVRNAELLAVHGGNFFEGSVGKSVVIVENSKVREVIGGGDAGKQLEKRGAYKNVVGETEVILNEVTGCSLCYGGGGGHCSVGKARVYANNSNVAWIFACGANGITLDGELYLNSGTYNCVSQVNRGLVVDSKVFMNGGLAKNVYFGGETEDTTVDGGLRNGLIVLNGGTVNNLNYGTSDGVELTEMNGYIRDCTIKAGDASNLVELNDRPENPEAGDFMFDVVLNKPIFFNGTHWVDSLGFIVG